MINTYRAALSGAVELASGYDARTLPWHWNVALQIAKQVETIIANSAYDADNLVAPKEIWFDHEELKRWYDDRTEALKQSYGTGIH